MTSVDAVESYLSRSNGVECNTFLFNLYVFALNVDFVVNSAFSRVLKVRVHEEHDGGGEESFDVINHKRSD